MDIVALFFIGKLAESVDNLAVIPLSILYVIGCTHNGNVKLSATCTNVVPVNEVDVSKLTTIKNADRILVLTENGIELLDEAKKILKIN